MAVQEIRVPDIGGYSNVGVVEVYVSVGDMIAAEDSLISLESEKAVMDIPSPLAGRITEIIVKPDDAVSEGDLIARIETAGQELEAVPGKAEVPAGKEEKPSDKDEAPSRIAAAEKGSAGGSGTHNEREDSPAAAGLVPRFAAGSEPSSAPASAPEVQPEAESTPAKPLPETRQQPGAVFHASPSVRQLAREMGAGLEGIAGSGPKGRVTREDVAGYVKKQLAAASALAPSGSGPAFPSTAAVTGIPSIPLEDFSRWGATERISLGRIRKISGPRLHAGWLNIPLVTHFDEADVTGLESFRAELNAAGPEIRWSILPFIILATVRSLQTFPDVNASIDAGRQELVRKQFWNIGIAVDTPDGLVVPVIHNADTLSLGGIARKLVLLSGKARDGKLAPGDLSGGTFSISSLGGIGGTGFTPLVNTPQAGIFGISRTAVRPVWDGQAFAPRTILPFSFSYDHRIIDGAAAARFCRDFAGRLEAYHRLLTD